MKTPLAEAPQHLFTFGQLFISLLAPVTSGKSPKLHLKSQGYHRMNACG